MVVIESYLVVTSSVEKRHEFCRLAITYIIIIKHQVEMTKFVYLSGVIIVKYGNIFVRFHISHVEDNSLKYLIWDDSG